MAEARLLIFNEILEVDTDFNQEFVNRLKVLIPYKYRAWDPSRKRWRVDRRYRKILLSLMESHFEYVSEVMA